VALAFLLTALPALVPPAHAGTTAKRTRTTLARAAPAPLPYGLRDDVRTLAAALAAERALDPAWVEEVLAQARHVPSVARWIQPPPPGAAKNWTAYRARFVEPTRIRAGVAFWEENEPWLREAEARFGVPPEIVVGIVGVETLYGRHMGDFRVLDALATLALDFPAEAPRDRSPFFRDELGSFLVLCRSRDIDPLAPTGSYAGASGMP
jgi:membrane-bound lytic murein transglycosylase B